MRALAALLFALLATSAPAPAAITAPYDGVFIDTATGKAIHNTSGSACIAPSSTTKTTCRISMDGQSGSVRASSFTAVYGVSAGTFSGVGSGLTGIPESAVTNLLTDLAAAGAFSTASLSVQFSSISIATTSFQLQINALNTTTTTIAASTNSLASTLSSVQVDTGTLYSIKASTGINADITRAKVLVTFDSATTFAASVTVRQAAQFGAGVLQSTFSATPSASVYALVLSSGLQLADGIITFKDGTKQYTAAGNGSGDVVAANNNNFTGKNSFTNASTFTGTAYFGSSTTLKGSLFGPQIVQAWAVFYGTGSYNIVDGVGVTSITHVTTGDYRVNFSTPFLTNFYGFGCTASRAAGSCAGGDEAQSIYNAATAARARTNINGGADQDLVLITVWAFGRQ